MDWLPQLCPERRGCALAMVVELDRGGCTLRWRGVPGLRLLGCFGRVTLHNRGPRPLLSPSCDHARPAQRSQEGHGPHD